MPSSGSDCGLLPGLGWQQAWTLGEEASRWKLVSHCLALSFSPPRGLQSSVFILCRCPPCQLCCQVPGSAPRLQCCGQGEALVHLPRGCSRAGQGGGHSAQAMPHPGLGQGPPSLCPSLTINGPAAVQPQTMAHLFCSLLRALAQASKPVINSIRDGICANKGTGAGNRPAAGTQGPRRGGRSPHWGNAAEPGPWPAASCRTDPRRVARAPLGTYPP